MSTKGGHREHPEVSAAIPEISSRMRAGDATGAARDAVRLASSHPDDARIHDLASTALALIASRDLARTHAARALELSPSDPALVARCASVLQRAGEPERALLSVERALRARRLVDENRRLSEQLVEARGERERLVDLLGRSAAMQKVFRHVTRVADSTATVFVTGENSSSSRARRWCSIPSSTRPEETNIIANHWWAVEFEGCNSRARRKRRSDSSRSKS